MVDLCPSRAWDRHCADMDKPYPAGPRRQVRSAKQQVCGSCYGRIEPSTPHLMQPMLNDIGLFCAPMRLHLDGECLPPPKDWWDE